MHTTAGVRPTSTGRAASHAAAAVDGPSSSSNAATADDSSTPVGGPSTGLQPPSRTCGAKELLLSSSDTDDCDAPDKLVIDLDGGIAAGSAACASTADHAPVAADTKPPVSVIPAVTSAGNYVNNINNNNNISISGGVGGSASAITSRNNVSDSAKMRGNSAPNSFTVEGAKSSTASQHHRLPPTSKSDPCENGVLPTVSAVPPPPKGLKMKIKCSQTAGAGGTVRHEVSHFHPLGVAPPTANNSVPTSLDSSRSVESSSVKSAESVQTSVPTHSRTGTTAGSHRKDHRGQATKDHRTAAGKDRTDHSLAGASNCGLNSVVASSQQNSSSSLLLQSEDVKPMVDGLDRDLTLAAAPPPDPYEFKTEDAVSSRPMKKIKLEKYEAACSPIAQLVAAASVVDHAAPAVAAAAPPPVSPPETRDAAVDACHVGVVTDPDCLGPCEPGTTVTLDGIVWNETENGLLVVNVTWRGKTYVGTLMDATKHHWAPPRFATDSPTSDLDGRTPKGRGKRGRTCGAALRSEFNGSDRKLRSNRCATTGKPLPGPPASPARSEPGGTLPVKRARVGEPVCSNSDASSRANSKSSRSDSRMSESTDVTAAPEVLIECTAPNCSKKFRHINGLRYHQSRAHPSMQLAGGDDDDILDDKMSKVDADEAESASDGGCGSDGWRVIPGNRPASPVVPNCENESKPEKKSSKHRSSKSKSSHHRTAVDIAPPGSPGKTAGHEKVPADEQNVNGNREKCSKHKKKDRHKDSSTDHRSKDVEVAAAAESDKSSHIEGSSTTTEADLLKSATAETEPMDTSSNVENSEVQSASNDIPETNHLLPEMVPNAAMLPPSGDPNLLRENTLLSDYPETSELPPHKDVVSASFLSSNMPINVRPNVTPSKKQKPSPMKHPSAAQTDVDLDNPHSPAYSDISDANESAPMLEKEATPSCGGPEEDSSNAARCENRPLSRHLPEAFGGPFSNGGPGSASLYGQPPCLTPAVVPLGLEGPPKQTLPEAKPGPEKVDLGAYWLPGRDERPVSGGPTSSINQRLPRELNRPDGPTDIPDRNSGSGGLPPHRSGSRPQLNDMRSPHSPAAPAMPPTNNMYNNMYPYLGTGTFPGLDATLFLQHPDYRAYYERLIQQEVTRSHDPSSTASRPPVSIPSDMKGGFPVLQPRSGDNDRRGQMAPVKPEMLGPGSLPTPPTLIPDRGFLGNFEDGPKSKGLDRDRRDDQPQRAFVQQQQPYPQDRQRNRHDDQMLGMAGIKDGSGKPSAVVAPQARDRNSVGGGSSKLRPDESPRPTSDRKSMSKSSGGGSGSDMLSQLPPTRTPKDLSDRGGQSRDDKGRSGQQFKPKEDGPLGPPPSVSGPLPMSYAAPYYPYMPGAPPQYAGAPMPFDPAAIYSNMNPIIGYAGAPPGPFLHPSQMGYLPSGGPPPDIMMPPPGAPPIISPSDGKPRDLALQQQRGGFYPNDGPQTQPPAVHKIHELKDVAKGTSMSGSGQEGCGGPGAIGGPGRPESRGGPGIVGLGGKDAERGSPPMQRHLHTHHHMHMLGPSFLGFPADPGMMTSPQTAAPPMQRPYLGNK